MRIMIQGVEFGLHHGCLKSIYPAELEALCRVVESMWTFSPSCLLESLETKSGYGFEGAVAYAFHEEEPSEVPTGYVILHYLDLEKTMKFTAFRSFVIQYAKAHLSIDELSNEWVDNLSQSSRSILKLD